LQNGGMSILLVSVEQISILPALHGVRSCKNPIIRVIIR
jgi:hypothetical protein